jgi:hypothetical protein
VIAIDGGLLAAVVLGVLALAYVAYLLGRSHGRLEEVEKQRKGGQAP